MYQSLLFVCISAHCRFFYLACEYCDSILLYTEYWVLLIYRILSLIQISFYLFYDMDALMHLATSMYAVIYLISRET